MATSQGKIGRLPAEVREQVNKRLLDNDPASEILPWLNGLPEVVETLDAYFGGEPVSPQNLSNWKGGGYQKWIARRDRLHHLKSLADYSVKIADAAGGGLTKGLRSILAGNVLDVLENLDAENAIGLVKAVTALSVGEAAAEQARTARDKLALHERRADQKDRELELAEQKFERQTVAEFLKWANRPEARKILESGETKAVKMDQLSLLIFGAKPEGAGDGGHE